MAKILLRTLEDNIEIEATSVVVVAVEDNKPVEGENNPDCNCYNHHFLDMLNIVETKQEEENAARNFFETVQITCG